MNLLYFQTVAECGYADDIQALLTMSDKEFVPPLSSRVSSTQAQLSGNIDTPEGIKTYYESMSAQPVVVAVESGRCIGFMAFKQDYLCQQVQIIPNLYASTCVVHPDARGQRLMQRFYEEMIRLFPQHHIFTRTWHTNTSHLRVLNKLEFYECARLPEHRGPGMDTVYFCRKP